MNDASQFDGDEFLAAPLHDARDRPRVRARHPARRGACVLVETMISLARSLGLQSPAEGVEHEVQRRFLVDRGCQLAQGFLFAMQAPAAEISAGLTTSRTAPVRRAA
jgi:EAL domain-containing protein (putative c-di-GMP-specific phosphodiesterase class I)